MGGANIKPERALATEQQGLLSSETGQSAADKAKMNSILDPQVAKFTGETGLDQPAINMIKGLESGDPSKVSQAAAPVIGQVTQQFDAAKQNILDTGPRGAGRDFALEMLPVQEAQAVAGATGGAVQKGMDTGLSLGQSASDKLTNIASGLGSFSLQELGAGLRAGEDASSSNQNIMGAQSAKHASTMGFLGQLAGAAGQAYAGK